MTKTTSQRPKQRQLRTRISAVAVIADRTVYRRMYGILQTIKPFSVTSFRTADTHDPIRRVLIMNTPALYLLKRDY